jgi:archaellum biogenesis protein FlaJ (TadC family)
MKIFSQLAAHKGLAIILTLCSVVMFVGSLLAVPWLIRRAPRDYFTRDEKARAQKTSLPLKLAKNSAGLVLLAAGVAMLLLPGQGILTVVVGLALIDFPGKHALLVRMAKRDSVMRALNYFRKKRGLEPFDAPN